mmetsp:Transcript_52226/g.77994  ORF Transcript_52226/g.77994 Transcript_52226/m.77994 type:complete len:256 (-) Transcript_52226:2344-3111(-)
MHVPASWEHVGVSDGITTWGRHQEFTVEQLHDTTEFVVRNNLLEAEFQVCNQVRQAILRHLIESSIDDSLRVWLLLSHHSTKNASHFIEDRFHIFDTSLRVSGLHHKGADGSTRGFDNLAVQVHIFEHTLVVAAVHVVNVTSNRSCDNPRQGFDVVLGTVELGNVHQRGNCFFGGRRNSHSVQTARQETALDLHDLSVNLANDIISSLGRVILGVVTIKVRKVVDILVKVASPCRRNDGVDNSGSTTFVLSESLV